MKVGSSQLKGRFNNIELNSPNFLIVSIFERTNSGVIETILQYIGVFSALLPIGLFFSRKKKEIGLSYIFTCLCYSIVADLFISQILSKLSDNEFLSFRIYTIIEFILISLFLKTVINNPFIKKVINYLIIAFLIYALFDLFYSKSESFDSIPTGVSCIIILAFSIYYLYEQINSPNNLFLYSTSHFWIIVALIIYFSGTFFVYIYTQNNYNDPSFKSSFTIINASFVIIKNLLFSIAFIIKPGKEEKNRLTTRKPAF